MSDGTDSSSVRHLNIPQDYIEKEKSRQLQEIRRRYALYTQKKPQEAHLNKIDGQRTTTTTILVDDGAASGATMIAAAR
jgi:predicted phosphoribosyltransferase